MLRTFRNFHNLKVITTYVGVLIILFTIVPYIPLEHWSVRAFDFPHIQLTLFTGVVLVLRILFFTKSSKKDYLLVTALTACFIFQGFKILPYTVIGKYEVENASDNALETLSVYTSNVLQENDEKDLVVTDTERFDADIVLFTETNAAWIKYLNDRLKKKYRYSIEVPKENTYGMVLYSKFELKQVNVKYLVEDTIPSIHARVTLPSQKRIQLYAIHPAPPTPMHNPLSLDRDAELMQIGRLSKSSNLPIIVMGDFNDVAWSETTSLFQSYSGLLDLRKGRGLFNTYNANYWFLRWPLDHVFVSPEFRVLEVGLGSHVGSDHFPFCTHLALEPRKALEQELPVPTEETVDDALEQLEEEKAHDRFQKSR